MDLTLLPFDSFDIKSAIAWFVYIILKIHSVTSNPIESLIIYTNISNQSKYISIPRLNRSKFINRLMEVDGELYDNFGLNSMVRK